MKSSSKHSVQYSEKCPASEAFVIKTLSTVLRRMSCFRSFCHQNTQYSTQKNILLQKLLSSKHSVQYSEECPASETFVIKTLSTVLRRMSCFRSFYHQNSQYSTQKNVLLLKLLMLAKGCNIIRRSA